MLVRLAPDDGLSAFWRAILQAADPDFLFVLDPNLDAVEWSAKLAALDLQPFVVERLRERAEYDEWDDTFVESPTLIELTTSPSVLDLDRPSLTWRQAARFGLPAAQTQRVRERLTGAAPVDLGNCYLSSSAGLGAWLLFGHDDDVEVACRMWSLRALGQRPEWLPLHSLSDQAAPRRLLLARLSAPSVADSDVQEAADRWNQGGRRRRFSVEREGRISARGAVFGSQVQTAEEHRGVLRLSLPAPPLTNEPLQRYLWGVAEHRILTPNPGDPDGVVLARDECSRRVISGDSDPAHWRITSSGFAQQVQIQRPALVAVPAVRYQDAIAAPLEAAGFRVLASDKGRYQQRSLQLGRGLRFLAWCLRQRESARLLKLFDTYHGTGNPPPDYRRAARYDELRDELHKALRESRARLRQPLVEEAHQWLREWANGLLDRNLMVAGYVLACHECARRAFYRAEQVAQRFVCERCSHENLVPADALRALQLNEAFYQLRHNNGDVVTLLLAALRDRAERSMLYQPEVVVAGPNNSREMDAIALLDGRLILAEAKSNNQVTRAEIDWYVYVAVRSRAKEIIFATTSRARPLCAQLDCETCREQGGEYHRDYSWSDGARARVIAARTRLVERGVDVHTMCYQSLVSAHRDASNELAPFRR